MVVTGLPVSSAKAAWARSIARAIRIILSRLHGEVRLGRQVSHQYLQNLRHRRSRQRAHFVAMELIDGEDLATTARHRQADLHISYRRQRRGCEKVGDEAGKRDGVAVNQVHCAW
jgi:hypothetical protein